MESEAWSTIEGCVHVDVEVLDVLVEFRIEGLAHHFLVLKVELVSELLHVSLLRVFLLPVRV